MEQINTDYRIHVLSYLCHIQPGSPQIPSSGKSQLCSYWSRVKKSVLQLASGLMARCSIGLELCDFLFLSYLTWAGEKQSCVPIGPVLNKEVFQLASGVMKAVFLLV
jgi:hypothetical protein